MKNKYIRIFLVSVLLAFSLLSMTACNEYSAKDSSGIVGTWKLTRYTANEDGDRTNIKKEFVYYYFIFRENGRGYMKFREKTANEPTQITFTYSLQEDEQGNVSSVIIATSSTLLGSTVTTTFDYSNNFLQKGTLTFKDVEETVFESETGKAKTYVSTRIIKLKKLSNDIDVV